MMTNIRQKIKIDTVNYEFLKKIGLHNNNLQKLRKNMRTQQP